MENMKMRIATVADATEILAIYEYYILNTAITFEYDIPTVADFERRIAGTLEKYPYIVGEVDGKVVGYAYVSAFKGRAAYDWSVETSIYVDKDFHGLGLGKILYDKLDELCKLQNITNMNACIAYPNPESVEFHKKVGYETVAHFHKCAYKLDQWFDMIWMEKFIADHDDPPKNVVPFSQLSLTEI